MGILFLKENGGNYLVKYKILILFVLIAAVSLSGCTSQNSNSTGYKTFNVEGMSFQYPVTWNDKPIPANDANLTSQSGFKMLGVILDGNEMKDYTAYVGIGKGNITGGNLTEAANRLYKYYISAESGDYLSKTYVTLQNGYSGYVYNYGGTGASSKKALDSQTYILTKDNKTAYYIQFATPRGGFEQYREKFQSLINSINLQ